MNWSFWLVEFWEPSSSSWSPPPFLFRNRSTEMRATSEFIVSAFHTCSRFFAIARCTALCMNPFCISRRFSLEFAPAVTNDQRHSALALHLLFPELQSAYLSGGFNPDFLGSLVATDFPRQTLAPNETRWPRTHQENWPISLGNSCCKSNSINW